MENVRGRINPFIKACEAVTYATGWWNTASTALQ
jgi:hypothetical protein